MPINLKSAFLCLIFSTLLTIGPNKVDAATVYTFDVPSLGGDSLTGTITTDGNLGVLTTSDIISWSFTETFNSVPITFSENPSNSFLVLGQGPFAANSTGLYVPSGTGNRILWNDQSSTPYYTFFSVASNATPGTSALTYGIFNTSTNLDQDLEQSTVSQGGANYYFAVAAVPEPSTWAMMILGFMGVGFMAYRRRQLVPVVA